MDGTFNNPSVFSKAGFITNNEELRIVMVGRTGVGKSASGNTILDQEAFKSKCGAQSLTVRCKKVKGWVGGQKVAVVDTPGLFDTRYKGKKTTKDLSQCISFAAPGPHVFLVVVGVGRFTEEEEKSVEKIQQVFGDAADKYSMVLFTRGDDLDETIEDFMKGCPGIQHLVARCNNQYHVFNNKDKENRSQVNELMQKIRDIVKQNEGSHYTNEDLQEAERAIEMEKQRILKEQEDKIRREQEEILGRIEEKVKKIQEEMQGVMEQDKREREEEKKRERNERDEERQREGKQREEERRREREEKSKVLNDLKEQLAREKNQEAERIKSINKAQAREQAEESNPWIVFAKTIQSLCRTS